MTRDRSATSGRAMHLLIAVDESPESRQACEVAHGFWERIIEPSTTRYLIDRAPCPVLVVR